MLLTRWAILCFGFIYLPQTFSSEFESGSILKYASLFKGGDIKFEAINKFQYLNSNDYPYPTTAVQTAWAQGLRADYKSGYINDNFGFDASYVGVIKLAASKYFFTRQYLYASEDTDGDYLSEPDGFNKFEQVYFKQKFGDENAGVKLQEGQIVLNKFGALDSLSKMTNTSFYGVTSEINKNNYTLRTGYFSKYENTDSPYEADFKSNDGGNLDYIITGDFSYKNKDYSLLYFYGYTDKYLLQHGVSYETTGYPYQYKLNVFMNEGLSGWKEMSSQYKPFDDNAYHLSAEVNYIGSKWFMKLGYAYTIANRSTRLGRFLESADNVNFDSIAYGISEQFVNNKENVLGLMAMYQVSNSFSSGPFIRVGYGHQYEGNHLQDYEMGWINKWNPENVKNLTMFFGAGPNWTFKRSSDNTPLLDSNGDWVRGHGLCIASSINYKF
jgi:hypothetical protein